VRFKWPKRAAVVVVLCCSAPAPRPVLLRRQADHHHQQRSRSARTGTGTGTARHGMARPESEPPPPPDPPRRATAAAGVAAAPCRRCRRPQGEATARRRVTHIDPREIRWPPPRTRTRTRHTHALLAPPWSCRSACASIPRAEQRNVVVRAEGFVMCCVASAPSAVVSILTLLRVSRAQETRAERSTAPR
jgi:hypothetical protein